MNFFKTFIALFFLSLTVQAQNDGVCGQVSYTQIFVLDSKVVEEYVMKFDDSESFYEQVNVIKTQDNYNEKEGAKSTSKNTVIGNTNLIPKFYYNESSNFYFQDNFTDQILLVKEEIFNWNWKISNETKEIGKFLCHKATTRFRGRDYVVWFTKQIPISYGPWKFHGLPGLILEVNDTKGVVKIVATKIVAGKNTDCCIEVDKTSLNNAMSIPIYRERKDQLIDEIFTKLSSQLPKGSASLSRNKDCEDCGNEVEIFK